MEKRCVLNIKGLTDEKCSDVEKILNRTKGVSSAVASVDAQIVAVVYRSETVRPDAMIKRLKNNGITAKVQSVNHNKKIRVNQTFLALCATITVPFVLDMLLVALTGVGLWQAVTNGRIIQFVLASMVLFLLSLPIIKRAWGSVKRGHVNTSLFVMTASLAAYVYSVYNLYAEGELYFGLTCIFVTCALMGNDIELKSTAKTGQVAALIYELQPKSAILIVGDETKRVSATKLKEGDIVLVRTGQRIPVDGVICEGIAYLDETMLSGEGMLVERKEGDRVTGGTINRYGTIKIKVSATGADTILHNITQMVEVAQNQNNETDSLEENIMGSIYPYILAISLISVVITFWQSGNWMISLTRGVSVVMVSALGMASLAKPLVMSMAMKCGEKVGVLIKNATEFEQLSACDTVVFDKTGTITVGVPSVTDVLALADMDYGEVVRLIGSAEKFADHSIGREIFNYAQNKTDNLPDPETFEAVSGMGVSATVDGKEVLVGSRSLMFRHDIDTTTYESKITALERQGKIVMLVAVDSVLVAAVCIGDTIKYDSRDAISEIKQMDLDVIVMTGDRHNTTEFLSEEVGINSNFVFNNMRPEDKNRKIDEIRNRGSKLIMVGDGINDAPAIATADVGVAMGNGTEIVIEAADVVLANNTVRDLITAIRLSRRTNRMEIVALFWSFMASSFAIPFAMFGRLSVSLVLFIMVLSGIIITLTSTVAGGTKKIGK